MSKLSRSKSAANWEMRRSHARSEGTWQNFVRSPRFESVWATAIFSYAIFVGVQAHCAAVGTWNGWRGWQVISWTFSIAFLIELSMRMGALGRSFFVDQDWRWNYFDIFIGVLSIIEMAFDVWFMAMDVKGTRPSDGNSAASMRILRVLRVARLVRIVRIVRIVRFVRALRALVYSILGTLRSLLWAMILLFIIIYVFAVVFTQAVADHMDMESGPNAGGVNLGFHEYWGGLPTAMLTLFECVSSGLSWNEPLAPLVKISGMCASLFVFYICFASLAVMNVVTGVFCQSAIDGAAHDQELLIQEQMKTRSKFREGIRQIFEDIDEDHQGRITIDQLEQYIEDPRMQAYFAALELDTSDALAFFKLLDVSEGIDCEDFVMGCSRLKGNAKAVHLAQLIHENKKMRQKMTKFMRALDEQSVVHQENCMLGVVQTTSSTHSNSKGAKPHLNLPPSPTQAKLSVESTCSLPLKETSSGISEAPAKRQEVTGVAEEERLVGVLPGLLT